MLTKRVFDKSSTHHDLIDKFQCHAIFLSNSIIEIVRHKDSVKENPWLLLSPHRLCFRLSLRCLKLQQMILTSSLVREADLTQPRAGCDTTDDMNSALAAGASPRSAPTYFASSVVDRRQQLKIQSNHVFSCRYLFSPLGDFYLLCFDIWMAFVQGVLQWFPKIISSLCGCSDKVVPPNPWW